MNFSCDYSPYITRFLGKNYSDRIGKYSRADIGGQNYHQGAEGNEGTAIGVSFAENGREWWSANVDTDTHPGFLQELADLNIPFLVIGSFSLWGTEMAKRKKIPSLNIRGPIILSKEDSLILRRVVPIVADSLVLALCLKSLEGKEVTVTNRGVLISDKSKNDHLILSPTVNPMNYVPVRKIHGTIYAFSSTSPELFWDFRYALGTRVKDLIACDPIYSKFLKMAEKKGYI